MGTIKEYPKVKIGHRGTIKLPEELRDYLEDIGVTHVSINKVVDATGTRHEIRWKKPKQNKNHVERAKNFVEKF